jgi:S-adenosylmethionine:tRNA ribosyltransferase-isomerase
VTGGHFEGLFLESSQGNIWRLMGKTRGKLHPGEDLTLVDHDGREAVRLTLRGQQPDGTWVAELNSEVDTFELLEQIGRVPLPPYIRGGEMTDADRRQYQTVYAERPGAVAAPTAGLHFTAELLGRLQQQGVSVCRLTLHVGPGTFRPITADRVDQHRLDPEWGELDAPTVERINRAKNTGRVIAVGTTSVRVLETAGTDSTLRPYRGHTDLYIHPPYQFKVVDALMTNFHLPRTTLLVLVRTFGGDELIRRAYEEAIAERYRFYSYGDSMLIL